MLYRILTFSMALVLASAGMFCMVSDDVHHGVFVILGAAGWALLFAGGPTPVSRGDNAD